MNSLEPEVLKMIVETIHEIIQCPVCLATLRPPVTQCSSGHALCPECKAQIDECPICRQGFIETKPIILHQLLDALPRPCQFKPLGCTAVYIPGGRHEEFCSFRTVDCKVIDCEWTGQSRKLQNHLVTTHIDSTMILSDNDMRTDLRWDNFDCSLDTFRYIPFVACDQVFWEYIHMNTEVNKLCISFTHTSNDNSNCEYFVVISFKNGDIGYTYTIKIPLDNNHMFIDFYEEYCMTIPKTMLPRFVNSDASLVYNIHIVKEDIK